MKIKSFEDNLKDFILVHGDTYDYPESTKRNKDKFNVLCKKHGLFTTTVGNHKQGKGCPKCSGRKKSFEDIVEICNKLHSNSFIYHKILTKNSFKVIIECKKHGITSQELRHHLRGHGCRLCADAFLSGSSWSYSDWEKASTTSKHFDSFKVYMIRCFNENEEFIKIR